MYKYVGNGEHIPGVPARDLSDAEAKEHGVEGSPLYKKTGPERAKGSVKEESSE